MKFYLALYSLTVLALNFENCLSKDLELLILHTNDMHSRFEQTSSTSGVCTKDAKDCVGGFARVANVVRAARKAADEGKGPKVLFLNAGDTYMGTAWFNVHRWQIVSQFLNLLKPDVVSFGNHEFDDKVAGVVDFIKNKNFPIVAANLDFKDQPELIEADVTKSEVLEVEGNKIGVIGYLTPETLQISAPENVKFEDEVEAIKKESERLDKAGVKIIIALGHSGYAVDQKIAKEVPLVDLVVGGHTDTFLWNGEKPDLEEVEGPYPTVVEQSSGKKVPVVQAYAFTKYMGRLTTVFNDKGDLIRYSGDPQLLANSVTQEQDFLDLLEVFRPAVDENDKKVIGKTRVTLEGGKGSCTQGGADNRACREKECNFANMITDAYVAYHSSRYAGSYWTDAPIALMNGGAIRSCVKGDVKDGSLTRGKLMEALPYQDQIYSMTLKGSDLLETLEVGVRGDGEETSHGEFLQSSGIRYSFDKKQPIGSRIIEAKVRCGLCSVPVYQPIMPDKEYKIITTGFLNSGGDGHTIIRDKGYDKVLEDLTDIDTLEWYMSKTNPVHPSEEERIIVLTGNNDDNDGDAGTMQVASVVVILCAALGLSVFR